MQAWGPEVDLWTHTQEEGKDQFTELFSAHPPPLTHSRALAHIHTHIQINKKSTNFMDMFRDIHTKDQRTVPDIS